MSFRIRERSTDGASSGRTFRWNPTTEEEFSIYPDSSYLASYERCEDHVNPGPPFVAETPLEMTTTQTDHAKMSFTKDPSLWGKRWENHQYDTSMPFARPIVPLDSYVNSMLGKINPNVPAVDSLLALRELTELPQMIWQIGRILLRRDTLADLPEAHLAVQWGWLPLMNDLQTLANLAEETSKVAERMTEGRTKRKLKFGIDGQTFSWSTDPSDPISPDGYSSFRFVRRHTVNRRAWCTLRVEPDFNNQYWDATPAARVKMAAGMYGTVSPATIWNMIPWTWLIDYFLTMGSYLDATRGALPFRVNSYCMMVRDYYTIEQELYSTNLYHTGSPSFSHQAGLKKRTYKSRYTGVFPKAVIAWDVNPLLDNLSILGSLSTAIALRSGASSYRPG